MKAYGLPYQGSKNGIAEWVINTLPCAPCFVDLFAGGGAVTHAALLSGKYSSFLANDIDRALPELFLRAIAGEYANETRWISREDFEQLKDSDPYVAICWSFGNNRTNYLYSKEVEPWKKALHFARVFGDKSLLKEFGIEGDGSREDVVANHEAYKEKYILWWLSQQPYSVSDIDTLIAETRDEIEADEESLRAYLHNALKESGLTAREVGRRLGTQMEGHYFGRSQWSFPTREHYNAMRAFMPALEKGYDELVGLYRLRQRLQSLQSLQSLQRLQSLQVSGLDYREVNIPEGAVVYADPPYKGTSGYLVEFDHTAFYEWLRSRPFPVYVSEYTMPADFVCLSNIRKRALAGGAKCGSVVEGIFVHEKWASFKQKTLF